MKDFKRIEKQMQPGDCFILPDFIHEKNIYNEECLNHEEKKEISIKVYEDVMKRAGDGNQIILAYVNNIYECTFIPILKYIAVIKNHLDNNPDCCSIVFPRKVVFSPGTVNYFLAEHESQGVFLYNRESVFIRFVEEFCKKKNVKIIYLKWKISLQRLSNMMRIIIVVAYKIFRDLDCDGGKAHNTDIKKSVNTDFIYVTRSFSQTSFVQNLTRENKFYHKLYIANCFNDRNHFSRVMHNFGKEKNSIFCSQERNTLKEILRAYGNAIAEMLRVKKSKITFWDVDLDYTQAMREIFSMVPELELYMRKLDFFLKNNHADSKIFFSTEQKTPHAYVDAAVARKNGYFSVQLMQCDQSAEPLPNPVPSDMFIADSRQKFDQFYISWYKGKEKLRYFGSIKALSKKNHQSKKAVCFFSDCEDQKINIYITDIIIKAIAGSERKLFIKLHPRNMGSWQKKYQGDNGVKIINHGEINQEQLFEMFDIAVLSHSAVALDLLLNCKLFILIDIIEKFKGKKFIYADEWFKPVVKNLDELRFWISAETELYEQNKNMRLRYNSLNGNITDSADILDKIISEKNIMEKKWRSVNSLEEKI